jgi:pre-mRNA-splicing factor 18
MDFLKAEIERKRKINEDIRLKLNSDSNQSGGSKFVRYGDRVRIEEEELQNKQKSLELERAKRARVEEIIVVKDKKPANSLNTPAADLATNYSTLSVQEVKNRLRGLRQPITLFAETAAERTQRLVDCMSGGGGEDHDDIRVGQNISEDEDEEAELEADDQADAAAEGRSSKASSSSRGAAKGKGGAKDDEDSEDDEEDKRPMKDGKRLEWDPSVHFTKIGGLAMEKVVYKFFRALTKQWEADLNQRDDWDKRTAAGKKETKTQKQCKDYIRPLFRMCKKKEVPYDILDKLVLMVKYCEEGNFLAANDQYIRTAIGNSAWPIGLTMVGIHERSGREKISTSKVFLSFLYLSFVPLKAKLFFIIPVSFDFLSLRLT